MILKLKKCLRRSKHHLRKMYYNYLNNKLHYMKTMVEFDNYIKRVRPREFLSYKELSHKKRIEFISVIDELNVNLKDKYFLDLGPGYGDALNIAHEYGAKSVEFIENYQLFYHYNRLKDFTKGYFYDIAQDLSKMCANKYDVIWLKGSVWADFFVSPGMGEYSFPPLIQWLNQLEKLATSANTIIICPYWHHDKSKRKISDINNNLFTQIMLEKGYIILPKIKGHNKEPEYPITFIKH
jgi:hypothetical protein